MIEVKLLIRQIRSFGSFSKVNGVHAGHLLIWSGRLRESVTALRAVILNLIGLAGARKPKVTFKTPTYLIGGSNLSSTPQGGYYTMKSFKKMLIVIITFGGFLLNSKMLFSPVCNGDLDNNEAKTKLFNLLYSSPKV